MSEHLLIYLDESGDLGFDFSRKKTTRYLVMTLLVCWDSAAHLAMIRSVKIAPWKLVENSGLK